MSVLDEDLRITQASVRPAIEEDTGLAAVEVVRRKPLEADSLPASKQAIC